MIYVLGMQKVRCSACGTSAVHRGILPLKWTCPNCVAIGSTLHSLAAKDESEPAHGWELTDRDRVLMRYYRIASE